MHRFILYIYTRSKVFLYKLNHPLHEYLSHRPHYYIAHQYVPEAQKVRKRKNSFVRLFSVHNTISLSRHERHV